MRMKLRRLRGKRKRFTALFLRRERRAGLDLVLLTNVSRRGEEVADHVWVEDGYWSRDWEDGDKVRVEARIEEYERRSGRRDYRLRDLWPIKNYTAEGLDFPHAEPCVELP